MFLGQCHPRIEDDWLLYDKIVQLMLKLNGECIVASTGYYWPNFHTDIAVLPKTHSLSVLFLKVIFANGN